jgi:hypothetical protein
MSDFLRALFVWLLGYHITTFFLSQRFNIATDHQPASGIFLTINQHHQSTNRTRQHADGNEHITSLTFNSLSLSPSNGESKWMGK